VFVQSLGVTRHSLKFVSIKSRKTFCALFISLQRMDSSSSVPSLASLPPSQSLYERLRSYFPGNAPVTTKPSASEGDLAASLPSESVSTIEVSSSSSSSNVQERENIPRSNPVIITPSSEVQTSVIPFSYSPSPEPLHLSTSSFSIITTSISVSSTLPIPLLGSASTPPVSPLNTRKSGDNVPLTQDEGVKSPSRTPSAFFRFSGGNIKTESKNTVKGTIHIQFKTVWSLEEQQQLRSQQSLTPSSSSDGGEGEGEESKEKKKGEEHDLFLFTTFLDASSSFSVVEAMKRKLREVKNSLSSGGGTELTSSSPLLPRKDSASQQNLPMMKEISLVATPPYDFFLSKLPTELLSMRTLQKLVLERHYFALPSEIGFLCLLEVFKASHCKLKSLPHEFSKLTNLKSLGKKKVVCSTLHFTLLPSLLSSYFKTLTTFFFLSPALDLSNNNLGAFPVTICHALTRLEKLKLNHNDLGSLPDNLGKLVQLHQLELQNNKLSTLPSTFCLLEKLRYLNLSNNQLMSNKGASEVQITIFASLKELSSLTFLDISNNNFNLELPSSISSLVNLTHLNLSNNQFSSIPWQLASLSKLTTLELSKNNLNYLPLELSRLYSLAIFLASRNKINSWRTCDTLQLQNPSLSSGGSFSSLHTIDLSFNPLSPAFIVTLCEKAKHLRSLDLSNNALTAGKSLSFLFHFLFSSSSMPTATVPPELATLSSLTSLDLSQNSLSSSTLTGEFLSGLKNLQQLYLSFNNLQSLPDSLWEVKSTLRELDLSQNPLTSVPPYLHKLTALEVLRLHSDRVTVIPSRLPPKLTYLSVMNMTIEGLFFNSFISSCFCMLVILLSLLVSLLGFARCPYPSLLQSLHKELSFSTTHRQSSYISKCSLALHVPTLTH
jgi:Leucine-rich repeat (LRR) protein